jgi:FkbM family methyltransferase
MSQWEERALAALARRDRMRSFGANAIGLLVRGKHGTFAVDPEDASVTRHLLETGEYGEDEIELASSFIAPHGDVLIVGTHIGALAVPISRLCRTMDAVEANPATVELVRANLRLNDCRNVNLHAVAASDSHGRIEFLMSRENSGGSKRKPLQERIHYVYDAPNVVSVEAAPLDDLLAAKSYDYILMDIEGSEFFALRGMQRILAASKAICVEFLPHHLVDVAGVGAAEFWDTLEPHFEWLYVPATARLVGKSDIVATLSSMMQSGEGHDGLCFMKTIPADLRIAGT